MQRTTAGITALVLLLASACAQAGQVTPQRSSEPSAVCARGSSPLFSADTADAEQGGELFAIFAAVGLPGGSAIISYDANTPRAGAEVDSTGNPRLVQLASDHSVADVILPVINGVPVSVTAVPLVARRDGTVYFYDEESSRVVARESDGQWRAIVNLDRDIVNTVPPAAIGPDDLLYLATVSTVIRIDEQGQTTRIAGASSLRLPDISFPQPPVDGLPKPALEVNLPILSGLVVSDNRIVYLSTQSSILKVAPDGVLSLIAAPAGRGPDDGHVVIPRGFDAAGGFNFAGLAIDGAGDLLVADAGYAQILRITGDRSEPVLPDVRFLNNGAALSRELDTPLLVVTGGQDAVCAYSEL